MKRKQKEFRDRREREQEWRWKRKTFYITTAVSIISIILTACITIYASPKSYNNVYYAAVLTYQS